MTSSILLNKNEYKYQTWVEKFPDYKVDFSKVPLVKCWKDIIEEKKLKYAEDYLSKCLEITNGKIKIYPLPDLTFSALNYTSTENTKVVFWGQDPYINEFDDVPEAMGTSFSIPVGIKIPSSLKNIYKNLYKYGHFSIMPSHGNLQFWAYQGCLMLNSSLTVQAKCSNSHSKCWIDITDDIMRYISKKCNNIIFVLWGRNACDKLNLIDTDKHKVIISSHPSGFSNSKPMGKYPAFDDVDHFGKINEYLKGFGKKEIVWQII